MKKETSNINLSKIDLIIHAIYDREKFKKITSRFFQVMKIKTDLSNEEIQLLFEDFIYSAISEKIDELEVYEKAKRLRERYRKNVLKLKKRWANTALESLEKKQNTLLKKEFLSVKNEFIENGKLIVDGISCPDDLIEKRRTFLDEWSSNILYNVTDYPYLKELSDKKINNAFEYDLILCITEILMVEYQFDINKVVVKSPVQLAPGLFIPKTAGRKSKKLLIQKKDNNYISKACDTNDSGESLVFFYEFSLENKSENDTTFLKFELDNEKQIELDSQDLEIIRYAYTYSPLSFNTFYTKDIINYLGLTDTQSNYSRIEEKFLKLPKYTFYTEKKDESGKTISKSRFVLFSRVDFEFDESGRRIIKTQKAFINEIDTVNTEIMYRNELKKLKLPQSKNLAYLLEGIRSYEIFKGIDIKDKSYIFGLDKLKKYVHFKSNKTKENMQIVEDGLKEILKNQFIIKDYKKCTGYFEIWFYEDVEKRKHLLNNTILSLPDYLNV